MGNNISIKSGSWCGDRTVNLAFPEHWNITVHPNRKLPEIPATQIESLLEKSVEDLKPKIPLNSKPNVAIVIDDHTRPTPVADILKPLIGLLNKNGIPNKNIKILVAIGTHILKQKSMMRCKLGEMMDSNIQIIYPDCRKRQDLAFITTSNTGIPIYINRHFANADLKIAISGIYPHDEAGFSGGAKILVGILGLETLSKFHRKYGLIKRGSTVNTEFRKEIEHYADLVNLDYSINCIVNNEKKIADLYYGDFRTAFREAVKKAKDCFQTTANPDADVVIANAYPLDNSLCVLGKSKWPFNYYKATTHKIILTPLLGPSDDRIPHASNRKEFMIHNLKRNLGASAAKRSVTNFIHYFRHLSNPGLIWDNRYVIYITYMDPNLTKKPKIINNCFVEYDWYRILFQLSCRLGNKYPVNASIYSHTPLLFIK